MSLEKSVVEIFNSVKPELWYMFFQACLILGVVLILKKVIDNVSSYFMFRYNKHLGAGVRVIINGMEGVIEDYDYTNIYVKIEGGNNLIMPIARWRFQNWIVKDFTKELTETKEKE